MKAIEPDNLNRLFFVVGMLIVGFSTNWNLVALLGAFVASLHLRVKVIDATTTQPK